MKKLVRDNIPDIIRADGLDPIIHVADDQEYDAQLRAKLTEEVDEFLTSHDDQEELADILEVLHALTEHIGSSPAELEKLRAAKASQRGGFEHRIILSGNRDQ